MNYRILSSNVILALICIILGIVAYKGCEDTKQLKEQNNQIKRLNSELVQQIQEIEETNDSLLTDIASYNSIADSLETVIKTSKKAKIKLVETIKYVKVENDTINNLIALNKENDRIIDGLDSLLEVKNKIILSQELVIKNYGLMKADFEGAIAEKDKLIEEQNKQLLKATRRRNFWRASTLVSAGALIVMML